MTDDAPLETGYGPRAPSGDNLINDFTQETAASFRAIAEARGDRVRRVDSVVSMTDAQLPLPFWNRAVLEQPCADADELIATVSAFFAGGDGGPLLLDSTWPTPDLRANGFTLMGHPPLMVRSPHAPLSPGPPELRVVEVRGDATDFERTLIDGYPAPPMQPFERVRMMTPGALAATGWHHFVGYVDDRPVTAGSCYVGDRLLRVENIATLDSVRGRGYGNAITAATIAVDLSKPAVLVASDLGRPVYERLGFAAVLRATYWLGPRI